MPRSRPKFSSLSLPKPWPEFGFTLIEILVVIMTMVLLSGLGFASYRSFARRQALLSASKNIKSDLRFVQTQTLMGRKPAGQCDILQGYVFERVSASRYRIKVYCTLRGPNPNCNSPFIGPFLCPKTVDLPPGVTLNSFSQIIFNVLGRGTNITSGSQVDIVLTQGVTGSTQTITVTSTGEIK